MFWFDQIFLVDLFRKTVNNKFKSVNFGESKGLTYERVLIYPTQPFIRWIKDSNTELPPTSRSKLYVAITRAKYRYYL